MVSGDPRFELNGHFRRIGGVAGIYIGGGVPKRTPQPIAFSIPSSRLQSSLSLCGGIRTMAKYCSKHSRRANQIKAVETRVEANQMCDATESQGNARVKWDRDSIICFVQSHKARWSESGASRYRSKASCGLQVKGLNDTALRASPWPSRMAVDQSGLPVGLDLPRR